ncbi:MAG: DUF2520 domain-containing protein [Firmicutes bacterium]|nr:DUF2520 domain-containing protein [Bacillota bacterium]
MRIVFIGAGNLSTHFSKALQNAGFEIAQVYSRTKSSAKILAEILQTSYTTDILKVTRDATLYIVSICDDAINTVSNCLMPIEGLVVHTSGSVSINVFSTKFKNFGVIYPLQTFSKKRKIDFSNIPFFLEANSQENLQSLLTVAKSISDKVYIATSEERMKLHLAAVFGCNFVNHLYQLSYQIAHQAGFDFDVLSPLIYETALKAIFSGNPKALQTGPAVRKDHKVMQKHLDYLSTNHDLQKIYALISENIIKQSAK